jgi:hypothetical protein
VAACEPGHGRNVDGEQRVVVDDDVPAFGVAKFAQGGAQRLQSSSL